MKEITIFPKAKKAKKKALSYLNILRMEIEKKDGKCEGGGECGGTRWVSAGVKMCPDCRHLRKG